MITRVALRRVFFVRGVAVSVRMHVPIVGVFMDVVLAKQVKSDVRRSVDQSHQCDAREGSQDGESPLSHLYERSLPTIL
jgi:hypothetical protein